MNNRTNMNKLRYLAVLLLALMSAAVALANHPWLARVYDYRPAPGQFVNTMPVFRAGEPVDSVIARCRASLCGRVDTTVQTIHGETYTRVDTVWAGGMITLGGYGGYVIVGFDHPVVNMHTWDFDIWGNDFVDAGGGNGSSEPGIVMVGVDADGDGVPGDGDRWYELAGSDYSHPTTQHGYSITYYRPDEGKTRTPSPVNPALNDTSYIRWTSNDANPDSVSGYMSRNTFHSQSYWPQWLQSEEELTFSGTKLRCNATDMGNGGSSYFVQQFFDWGYVDNLPNNTDHLPGQEGYNLGFKIDWAVDENGNHVNLDHIDFIKVYTAVNQYCGWMGETSTEVSGGIDFHPDAQLPEILVGDVNRDGEVNIADVNAVIDIILGYGNDADHAADVNRDGEVNISDVNAAIDIILSGK